jgi:1,4-alpha-glucan branching enzyme
MSYSPARYDVSRITDDDLHLFHEGNQLRLAAHVGAHVATVDEQSGAFFSVWAPNAESVAVVGDFNEWNSTAHPLGRRGELGVWEAFVPGASNGHRYKFHLHSRHGGYVVDKADPLGFATELAPRTASVVTDLSYAWGDAEWLARRRERNGFGAPISIYEVHLGSWRRVPEEGHRWLSYREIAPQLADYALELGFSHVELMPIMEHPFYASWGYQTTGYFAPTSRYGSPQDLMFLIDYLHQRGIGVILDWVPSHFPSDEHGLGFFDGTHLYEHADPRQGFHPDWKSLIFNYDRNEVRSFLLSSALFWLETYHADALRVDAVASMLYLDYSRSAGEWVPNAHGGRENLAAIGFLRKLNEAVYQVVPEAQTVAEESTAWPMVSRPTYMGGLGFGMKWDMGWMHDTLAYFGNDPIFRPYRHHLLTFRPLYAFWENFVLPLSHDEVVHGKGSLAGKQPGDAWQKLANLRALYGYMYAQPGKKLMFMGDELGQWSEWNHDASLDWHLLDYPPHRGVQRWVADLNRCYREQPALHELDFSPEGFEWIDCNDALQSVVAILRRGQTAGEQILIVGNFTPVPRKDYRVGVPVGGRWRELLNSDALAYGGSGLGNQGSVVAQAHAAHGRPWSVQLTLPPLAVVFLKPEGRSRFANEVN